MRTESARAVKRVMFTVNSLSGGGAERVLAMLCSEMAERGIEVCLCLTGTGAETVYGVDARVRVEYAVKPFPGQLFAWRRGAAFIRKLAREFKPDVIAAFKPYSIWTTLSACRGLGAPVVMAVRGMADKIEPEAAENIEKNLKYLGGAVFMSDEQRVAYRERFPALRRVPYAVILNPISPSKLWDRGREKDEKEIISVGRLHPQKNFPMLINAFARLSADFPDWKLTVYGEGALRDQLTALIEALGLSESVKLPGFVKNIDEKYLSASFFALSSSWETFGNVIAEAMCMGTPCIATDCEGGGGAGRMMTHGVDGLVVPSADEDALTAAMRRFMEDADYAESLGQAAKRLRERLDLTKICGEWLDFFSAVTGGGA